MNNTPTTLREILVQMLENHEFELKPVHTPPSEYESVDVATQSIQEQLKALLEPFHYSETPSPCGVQRTGRWKRPCDCGLDQAIDDFCSGKGKE